MKRIFFALCMCVGFQFVQAQIKSGESLVFAASYEISGLMTNIAQVTLRTENISTSKNTFLHLILEAETFNKWDSFFKVRDLYESYVNPATLKPSMYKRDILEGNYTKTEKYIFSADGKTINSTSKKRNRAELKRTFNIGTSTLDVVTLIYKIRTVDFSKLKPGQSIAYTIVFDETEYPVTIRLMGTETVSAGNLGKKECYKLSIGAKTDRLKGTDKNLIWLSTDSKRIPCQVKFSIPVGVGQLNLSKASGI
ncbi:MAG: DUF3108 domain-containing protein [Paludibacter sp.]|nr:DUF3108 domain-containing protein [Paludibacter sp.]